MAYNWETYYYKDPDWVSTVNKLRTQTTNTVDAMSNNILEAITSLKSPHSLSPYASTAMNQPVYQSLGTVSKYKLTDDASKFNAQSFSVNTTDLSKFGKISNALTHSIKLNEIDQDISTLKNGDSDYGNAIKVWMEDAGYITSKQRAIKFSRDYFFINRPYLESDVSGPYRSFCFLTRPNLNLVIKQGDRYLPQQELSYYPELMALVASDLELYAELCRDGCHKSNLWTFASNYISNVASPTFGSTDVEGIKNGFGVEQKLPSVPDYHNVQININFMDNSRSDMAKLFNCIDRYKYAVNKEGYPMRDEYIKYKSIDYLMSMYIVIVDANWEVISFSTCITMTPGAGPTKFVSHNMDGITKDEGPGGSFDVDFNCMTYRPHNPLYFDSFNLISGFNPYDIVDTRGTTNTLQVQARPLSREDALSPRISVYEQLVRDNNYGYAQSVNPKISNAISDVKNYAYRRYRGINEMLGLKPGIYLARRSSDRGRPVFKLGFSY
jgi:hypothetical protein